MGAMRNLCKMVLLLCLLSINSGISTAWAEPPAAAQSQSFIGQYYFSWAGIHLGNLAFSIEEKPESYSLHLSIVSAGLVNWFTHHTSDTVATGKIEAGRYLPQHYESSYKTKKKPRHIRLTFDEKGRVTEVLNEPPEDRTIRPEVPAKLLDGSYDPLTGLLVLRKGQPTLMAFDVKRLYEVKAEDKGTEKLNVLGVDTETQHYILTRKPLGGMTDKEMLEYNKGEPPLSVYFSKDAKHVPVYIYMPILMNGVSGSLVKECRTWDECKV